MSTRTSQGTIAWVVSLNTFPYLAVPAYWILGRSRFKGYVKAHQVSGKLVDDNRQLFEEELAHIIYHQLKYCLLEVRLKN
jgi:cardiolipin synthase